MYAGIHPGFVGIGYLEDLCDEGKRLSIKWKREENRPQLLVMKVMKEYHNAHLYAQESQSHNNQTLGEHL